MDLSKETYIVNDLTKSIPWCTNLFYSLEDGVDLFLRVHHENKKRAGYSLCYKGVGAVLSEVGAMSLVCLDEKQPTITEEVRCFDLDEAYVYVSVLGDMKAFVSKVSAKSGENIDNIESQLGAEVYDVPTADTYSKARMGGQV